MNRVELKQKAKEQIKGKIGILFAISLIVIVIVGVISLIPYIGSIAAVIIAPALSISLVRIFLMISKDGTPEIKDIFSGFDDWWSAFKLYFISGLFIELWTLLLIVPGIIKSFEYSMAPYILAENKGMSALECIKKSREMTSGHKMDLFVLGLSFIGWMLLGYVTFGIAYIWVGPYIQATYTNVYNSLKPEKDYILEPTVDDVPAEEENVVENAVVEEPIEATTEESAEEPVEEPTEETTEE